jgi:hypothetical protein
MPRIARGIYHVNQFRFDERFILSYLVYNRGMLDFLFQLLAIYLFAVTPWFASWIANGGKREDVGIPIIGSILLAVMLMSLIYFFA